MKNCIHGFAIILLLQLGGLSCTDESTDPNPDTEQNLNTDLDDQADLDTPSNAALDCQNWQAEHPNWLWCDDFETLGSLNSNYQDYKIGDPSGFDISTNDAFAGQASLQQSYQTNQVEGGWISWFYADALGEHFGGYHDSIFVRWYHKFETGFEGMPPKMARVRRLEAGYIKSNAVHIWVETASKLLPIVADIYAPDSTQSNGSGWFTFNSDFHYSEAANIGRWVCHELQVSVNTAGQSDGSVNLWVDNELVLEQSAVDLRGNTGKAFNEIMLDTYWNGGSPKAQSRYFDNFVISTQRIGCQDID